MPHCQSPGVIGASRQSRAGAGGGRGDGVGVDAVGPAVEPGHGLPQRRQAADGQVVLLGRSYNFV